MILLTEATELILPQLQKVHATITNNKAADKKVIDILWRKLVECTSILAGIADSLHNDSFTFCRQVILEGAKHQEPKQILYTMSNLILQVIHHFQDMKL